MNKTRWIRYALQWIAPLLVPVALVGQSVERLNLKEAVDKAVKNSRDVALAQARYEAALNTVEVNHAAFNPSFFTGSGAAYTYGFPQTLEGAAPTVLNFAYVQPVFNPLQTAQTRASRERGEEQRLELEKTRNAVMLQASSAYLELGAVRHSLELMRNDRQSDVRISEFTHERVTEGAELHVEETRAKLEQAKTEQKIVQLEGRERVLEEQLAALLGLPSDARIEIDVETPALAENQKESDLADRALASSLEIQEAEHERKASEKRLEGEIGTKWPTAELFGQYGLFAKYNNFQQYFQRFQRNNFNVGLELRIPLFNGQRKANVALATSQVTAADIELQKKRESLRLQVSEQYQHVRELEAAREVARLDLELAQDNLRIVQAKFEEGKANLRDVERARVDENDKWLAFINGDYDWQKAQLNLMNITGDLGRLFQ